MSQTNTPTADTRFYDFGPFRVDAVNRLLLRDRQMVPLTSKVFDILLVFVTNTGRLLDKEDLMKQVWPESFVEEGNLTRNVSTLRKALGESPQDHHYIITVAGRGYQFVPRVSEVREESSSLVLEEHSRSHIVIDEQEDEWPVTRAETVIEAEASAVATAKGTLLSNRQRRVMVAALFGTGVLAVGFLAVYLIRDGKVHPSTSFSRISLTSLTSTGDVYGSTISPDGKYLAYSSLEKRDGIGLRVRQIAAGSTVQLIPARPVRYWGMSFSRDSEFVYYVVAEDGSSTGALYRVPTLGGHAEKLVDQVNAGPSMSPDGRSLIFARTSGTPARGDLLVANVNGKDERDIAVYHSFDCRGAVWSPDSKSVTYIIRNRSAEGQSWYVAEIPLDGSSQKVIVAPRKTRIVTISWLPDYSGLIMNADDPETQIPQLSFVSYPDGAERRITHDLNNYRELTITADSRTIVAQKMDSLSQLWIAPNGDPDQGRLLLTTPTNAYRYLSWTPDNQVVFDGPENGVNEIWQMGADGTGRERLTYQQGQNMVPSVTSDGQYIVFISTRSGSPQLWRMDANGGNPTQLTNSSDSITEPQCSPDGKWVVYTSGVLGPKKLLKTSIDGSQTTEIIANAGDYWAISPDSKLLAYVTRGGEGQNARTELVPLAGGEPLAHFDFEPDFSLQWTRDGRGLVYISEKDNNMWVQLITGGPPKQLTHLQPDLPLVKFAWSPDGKQLAYTRSVNTFDAVALQIR